MRHFDATALPPSSLPSSSPPPSLPLGTPMLGTPVTRQRLTAVGTPGEADKTSPSTSEPSAANIRRREAARPTGSLLSATTPFTARLRNASSMAHATSSDRRNPETTSNRPGAIP